MHIDLAIDEDGRTYFPSAALPPPHHSDILLDDEPHLSAMSAVLKYPRLGLWVMETANKVARDQINGRDTSTCRIWSQQEESEGDSK